MSEAKPARLKKDGTPRKKPGPAPGRKHPGRGGFKATQAMRENVQVAVASKQMTHLDIANAIGISINTLYKHFKRDLDVGFARQNFAMLRAQYDTGVKGNASAQDKWLKRAFERPNLGSYVEAEKPKKAPKLGKKEQAVQAAHNPDVTTSLGERMARRMAQAGITRH